MKTVVTIKVSRPFPFSVFSFFTFLFREELKEERKYRRDIGKEKGDGSPKIFDVVTITQTFTVFTTGDGITVTKERALFLCRTGTPTTSPG